MLEDYLELLCHNVLVYSDLMSDYPTRFIVANIWVLWIGLKSSESTFLKFEYYNEWIKKI
jgi:hypothetical protein